MKDWLTETIDQIALGEYLARSSVSCGQRFALIAVDNSIEYMFVAYVEVFRRLVGGHVSGGIPKNTWDSTKRNFGPLLMYVISKEPKLQPYEVEINRFHDLRNDLYHTGVPITVTASRVLKHVELARQVLFVLFNIQYADGEWDAIRSRVGLLLLPKNSDPGIKREVTFEQTDGVVKFATQLTPSNKEAIALALHGYSVLIGAGPDRESLSKSLTLSGHPVRAEALRARLSEMNGQGLIQLSKLQLKASGRKLLAAKYTFH